jgi:hypothetical protein
VALEEFELDCYYLKGSNLERNLPLEFSKLGNLKKVKIKHGHNNLSEFPVQIFTRNLKELHLIDCNLTREIGRASSLTSLIVSGLGNQEKSLPEEIGDLSNLRYLYVKGEGLEALPDSIGKLVSLEELIIDSESSFETLPDTMANLRKLKLLSLPNIYFCSPCEDVHSFPQCIYELTSLEVLNIPDVSSEIIQSHRFSELRKLKDIFLPTFDLKDIEEYGENFFFQLIRGRDNLNVYTYTSEINLKPTIQALQEIDVNDRVRFVSTTNKNGEDMDISSDGAFCIIDMFSRFRFLNHVFSSLSSLEKMKDGYGFLKG